MQPASDDLWFGTSGPRDARLVIVGESWGSTEAAQAVPFVGESGKELTRMLAEAGIDRSQCFLTNVVSAQPPKNDMSLFFHTNDAIKKDKSSRLRGLYPLPATVTHLNRLHRQIAAVKPTAILGLGNYALWALTQDNFGTASRRSEYDNQLRIIPTGITTWRGSFLDYNTGGTIPTPLVPAIHPAAIQRAWYLRAPTINDLRARVGTILSEGRKPDPHYSFTIRPTFDQVVDRLWWLINCVARGTTIAIDLETRGGHIACIGLAWSKREALCIPLMCVERDRGYWSVAEEAYIWRLLATLFRCDHLAFVGQNFLYDLQYIIRYTGVRPKIWLDTMLAQQLAWPGTPKALWYLSSLYCEYHRYWKEEGKYWDEAIPEEQLWRYNCIDACATAECAESLWAQIVALGRAHLWQERMFVYELCYEMMVRGVRIDQKERTRQLNDTIETMYKLESFFVQVMPPSFLPLLKGKTAKSEWYASPKQQMVLFYELLNCPRHHDRKTGNLTVDDDALMKIAEERPLLADLCENLRTYRSCGVFSSNFLTASLEPSGRISCSFNPAGTETFRLSSDANAFGRGTNLQNIPKGEEKD